MRPIPPAAKRQHGVFTLAQAAAAGWTRSALRYAVSNGELAVLRRGILALPPAPTDKTWLPGRDRHRQETIAALLTHPAGYASHCSAALLLDLPVLDLPTRPCLTVAPGHSGDVPGVHLHRTALGPRERGRLGSLRTTMPPRMTVDIARECGEAAGVVAADAALRRALLSAAELVAAVDAARGRPGIGPVRRTTGLLLGRGGPGRRGGRLGQVRR
jgi:hypothetical protein